MEFPVMDFASIEQVLFDDDELKRFYESINLSNSNVDQENGAGVAGQSPEEFLARDEKFQKLLAAGGENPSIGVDTWALNRLAKFRQHIGDHSKVELADMMPHVAVPLLCQFFEQVTKKNGKLYPTETLMGLLGAFNRVLRKAQEKRIMDQNVDEVAFNMKLSPMFCRACVACTIAMKRSKDSGANLPRKKSKVIKLSDEKEALESEYLAKTYSQGLQRRVGLYCEFRLGIRGASGLHNTTQKCFTFGTDENGRYLIYDETKCTKTNRPGMKKFQQEHFRDPLKTYEEDVVDTFERYFKRLPEGMEKLFLKPIDNPSTPIWYAKSNVGEHTLESLVNRTFVETGKDQGGAKVTNKSGRTSMVSRMGENGVPAEVGMLLTGHKSKGAYMRYDQSIDLKVRAAQRCINEDIDYEVALAKERRKTKRHIFGDDASCQDEESEISPPKKQKADEPGVSTMAKEMKNLDIAGSSEATMTQDQKGESKMMEPMMEDVKECEVVTDMKVEGEGKREDREGKEVIEEDEDYGWMQAYDWDKDYEHYQRNIVVNPINAVFGRINSLMNCQISLTIHSLNLQNP